MLEYLGLLCWGPLKATTTSKVDFISEAEVEENHETITDVGLSRLSKLLLKLFLAMQNPLGWLQENIMLSMNGRCLQELFFLLLIPFCLHSKASCPRHYTPYSMAPLK